jgi:hypothetical protein
MQLSIIIVSWNTRELTLKCLRSIFGFFKNDFCVSSPSNYNVFLIDNNSSDNTVEAVKKYKKENNYDNLKIIANKENLGFAKANNQALCDVILKSPEHGAMKDLVEDDNNHPLRLLSETPPSKGGDNDNDFILLLNPDTEFINETRSLGSPDVISGFARDKFSEAIEFMIQNPDCGILGPKLLNSDGSLQKSCRKFPKLLDQIFIQLKFYNFFPEKIESIREYFMLNFKHDEIKEVDQVMGAGMLIKKEVINKIGLLDEKFWAIFEEVDFCLRAKNAGYKTYFFPEWQIIHHKEQSFKQVASLRKQINFNKSLYHYFRKHKPFWQLFILWLFQPINLLLTLFDNAVGVRNIFGKRKDL